MDTRTANRIPMTQEAAEAIRTALTRIRAELRAEKKAAAIDEAAALRGIEDRRNAMDTWQIRRIDR